MACFGFKQVIPRHIVAVEPIPHSTADGRNIYWILPLRVAHYFRCSLCTVLLTEDLPQRALKPFIFNRFANKYKPANVVDVTGKIIIDWQGGDFPHCIDEHIVPQRCVPRERPPTHHSLVQKARASL